MLSEIKFEDIREEKTEVWFERLKSDVYRWRIGRNDYLVLGWKVGDHLQELCRFPFPGDYKTWIGMIGEHNFAQCLWVCCGSLPACHLGYCSIPACEPLVDRTTIEGSWSDVPEDVQ